MYDTGSWALCFTARGQVLICYTEVRPLGPIPHLSSLTLVQKGITHPQWEHFTHPRHPCKRWHKATEIRVALRGDGVCHFTGQFRISAFFVPVGNGTKPDRFTVT